MLPTSNLSKLSQPPAKRHILLPGILHDVQHWHLLLDPRNQRRFIVISCHIKVVHLSTNLSNIQWLALIQAPINFTLYKIHDS